MASSFRFFILILESKAFEWARAALEHDTLEVISAEAPHSSSILDLFTSFQQMIDFVKRLDWPDKTDYRKFHFAVFYDIIAACARYCYLSVVAIVQDLNLKRTAQPPPAAKTAKIGKLKVPIPKMIRKKRGTEKISGESRLPPVV
jgi:hypothetical protein